MNTRVFPITVALRVTLIHQKCFERTESAYHLAARPPSSVTTARMILQTSTPVLESQGPPGVGYRRESAPEIQDWRLLGYIQHQYRNLELYLWKKRADDAFNSGITLNGGYLIWKTRRVLRGIEISVSTSM